jgi:3-phenylpropionate/cinnamic acid dioxygenase small subunit
MSLKTLEIKEQLRDLIDAYATLGDDKKIKDVMALFTPDANYTVYVNGAEVANTTGTDKLEAEFNAHASQVKTYFTLNGQHAVKIGDSTATGVSFSQLKMVREVEGKDILTDYSVRYDDDYVLRDGKWLIKKRTGRFFVIEARPLAH